MKHILLALLCLCGSQLFAQTRTITGKVTAAEDNGSLPGVNVVVKGTATGSTTDPDGNYTIAAAPNTLLVFSYIGFVTQEISTGNQTTLNIQLASDVTQLTEVVVTGYNTQERKDITGSVTTVSPNSFKEIPVTGIDQALQGQAAGVQVTQSSGTPGGGINVRVRGVSSINASSRPLFVVDGVPVEDGALALRDFGGQNDNALATLNPNDIESITILKDAAAKATYGSRGSNGVVVVTTKRGKDGKTAITADVQRGIIDPVEKVELLNSRELLELQREALINAGRNPDNEGYITGVNDAVNTDWLDEIFRQAIVEQYQLSASGGNERTRFYLSGSYRREEGVQLNNQFQRYAGTVNLDHKATDKLSFGVNLTLSRNKNNRVKGDNFLDGVYSGALKSLPYYQPYDEQGRIIGAGNPGYAEFPNFNPVGQALLPRFETYTTKILGGVFAEYALQKELKIRSKISMDYNGVTDDQYEPSSTAIGGYLPSVGGQGYGVYGSGTYATLINTNTLTYNRTFATKHVFNGLLGVEILQRTERTSGLQARLFPRDDFTYIDDPDGGQIATVDQGNSFIARSGLLSAFGEVKYSYEDKYLASLAMRADGSSRFGRDRRFGAFPSVSVGWRVSAEPFMQGIEIIDDLKLRASYGLTGNERFGNFEFLGRFSGATYNGASGLSPDRLGNPELQWESTRELDLGVDVSVFNGRLSATVDGYSNVTSQLLLAQPLPLTTGFGSQQGNVGKVSNRGIEFSLTSVNLDGIVKWTTSLNLSRNINNVESLDSDEPIFTGYTATPGGRTNVVRPGDPIGSFWGLKFLGVDAGTGDAIYDDLNGDGLIGEEDATVIGTVQPDWIGGITNRITYRNFDISAFFQFSYGNEMLNFTNQGLLNAGEDLASNQVKGALKRWQQPGDITSVPRYEAENTFNNYQSSRFIEDGSYLRLKNVSLGYNLKSEWLTRLKLSTARIYVSGTNLWTLTPYSGADPEVSTLDGSTTAQGIDFYTLPQVRTLTVGITVGI